ncbi:MAG TPA: DUF433 domain-containing protein [Blastocatellia bacterium]|nr:DUF433 domain-containing protein [Blastocatellia bacterium]
MQVVTTSHIYLDENGVAWITGANTKVIEVVLDKTAYGWNPEEIHEQYPYLSLGQIHAAFSYYYDHQAELDADIERRHEEVEEMRKRAGESPLVRRLKELGKL